MDEWCWADRFEHDVDALLKGGERTVHESLPTEYREMLDLAHTLATIDFSVGSDLRHTLRRRLLAQINTGAATGQAGEHTSRRDGWHRRVVLTLAACLFTVFLTITLASPVALKTVAQSAKELVRKLVVGPHTYVESVVPKDLPAQLEKSPSTPKGGKGDDHWSFQTSIGRSGGSVPDGREPSMRHFGTFDEAQLVIPYTLYQPDYLPEGYALRGAVAAPDDTLFLFYDGPGGEIILQQTSVRTQVIKKLETRVEWQEDGSPITWENEVVVEKQVVHASVGVTPELIEKVHLKNGQRAAWIEGNTQHLVWEANGISFALGGANLSRDEAIRIAESLK